MGNSTSKERNKSDAGPSCNASPECTLHECLPSPQVANVTEENLNRLNNSSESGSEEEKESFVGWLSSHKTSSMERSEPDQRSSTSTAPMSSLQQPPSSDSNWLGQQPSVDTPLPSKNEPTTDGKGQALRHSTGSEGRHSGTGSSTHLSLFTGRSSFALERASAEMNRQSLEAFQQAHSHLQLDGSVPSTPFLGEMSGGVTLEVLAKSMGITSEYQEYWASLSVFPLQTPAPSSVLSKLWSASCEKTLAILTHLSSLGILHVAQLQDGKTWCLPQPQQLQLVKRAIGDHVLQYHRRLLDSIGQGKEISAELLSDDGYCFQQIGYHLTEAGKMKELKLLLLDPIFLERKLLCAGISGVCADFRRYLLQDSDRDVKLVLDAFQMSVAQVTAMPELPGLLRCLIASRMMAAPLSTEMKKWWAEQQDIIKRDRSASKAYCLTPITPSLDQAGGLQRLALRGHSGAIVKLIMAPSGSEVITASIDGTARIWDLEIGDCTLMINAKHPSTGALVPLTDVAITDDGSLLAIAGENGTVWAFETERGDCLRVLTGQHKGSVNTLALDPQGRFVATGGLDGLIIVWDLVSSKPIHKFSGTGPTGVHNLLLSRCCRFVIVGCSSGEVLLFDVVSGKSMGELLAHSGGIASMVMSHDGKKLVTGSHDRTAKLWDLNSGGCVHTYEGHTGFITTVAMSSNGKTIVTASDDSTARVWDTKTGNCRFVLKGHRAWVNDIAITPAGDRVLTAGGDGVAIMFSLETGDILAMLEGHSKSVRQIVLTRTGRFAITAGELGTCRAFDLRASSSHTPAWHEGVVHCLVGAAGIAIATSGDDCSARVWEPEHGEFRHVLRRHSAPIRWAKFSLDGSKLATASADHTVNVWSVATGKWLYGLPCTPGSRLKSFAACGLLETAVLCLWDGSVSVWDLLEGKTTLQIQKRGQRDASIGHSSAINEVIMTRDARRVVTLSKDCTGRVWDTQSGDCLHILSGHKDPITSGCISDETATLLTWTSEGCLKLWSLENGLCIASGEVGCPVSHVGVSLDGNYAAVGCSGGDVWLFDLRLPQLKGIVLKGHHNDVTGVSFSGDGGKLATYSKDATARLWDVGAQRLQAAFIGDCGLTSGYLDDESGSVRRPLISSFYALSVLSPNDCFFIMGGNKKKNSKGKSAPKLKSKDEEYLEGLQSLQPVERMAEVAPYWQSISAEQRSELLEAKVSDLRVFAARQSARIRKQREADIAETIAAGFPEPIFLDRPLDSELEGGLKRSQARGTWKVWFWPDTNSFFCESEAFKKFLHENIIPPQLLQYLPKDQEGSKIPERPSEAKFRNRMVDLLTKVQEAQRAAQEEVSAATLNRRAPRHEVLVPAPPARDPTIESIIIMLEALEQEHQAMYHSILVPISSFICEILPANMRSSSLSELHFVDLERINPGDCTSIYEWLSEKIDGFTTKLRMDEDELKTLTPEEEEPIGDVDLFALVENDELSGDKDSDTWDDELLPDVDGNRVLTVNSKWLSHLQTRLLGEDSQPRRSKLEEDPGQLGLVLEWVYGTIVSTAEKARDAAHRALGSLVPNAEHAAEVLIDTLQDHQALELKAKLDREFLMRMLNSRKEAKILAEKYGLTSLLPKREDTEAHIGIPNEIALAALRREVLLTQAKLHYLQNDHKLNEQQFKVIGNQLRQLEPEYQRLTAELEALKSNPRNLEGGAYRTAAEAERHRTVVADALMEEQLQIQQALRKTEETIKAGIPQKEVLQKKMAEGQAEMSQLTSWLKTIEGAVADWERCLAVSAPLDAALIDKEVVESLMCAAAEEGRGGEALAVSAAVRAATNHDAVIAKLRSHFENTTLKQLYDEGDDKIFFEKIQRQLRETELKIEESNVVLQHLEKFVIDVGCNDPGTVIGAQIILPFLQERLDLKALTYKGEQAAAAEKLVIEMEMLTAERDQKEKEKKLKAKAKAKERERSLKEKERADAEAKRKAEEEARYALEVCRIQQAEAAQRQRIEEATAARKAEEELMERRRQELLADENSYWRQRLEQDELLLKQAQVLEDLETEATSPGAPSKVAESAEEEGFVSAPTNGRRSRRESGTLARKTEQTTAKKRERIVHRTKGKKAESAPRSPVKPGSDTRAPSPPTPEALHQRISSDMKQGDMKQGDVQQLTRPQLYKPSEAAEPVCDSSPSHPLPSPALLPYAPMGSVHPGMTPVMYFPHGGHTTPPFPSNVVGAPHYPPSVHAEQHRVSRGTPLRVSAREFIPGRAFLSSTKDEASLAELESPQQGSPRGIIDAHEVSQNLDSSGPGSDAGSTGNSASTGKAFEEEQQQWMSRLVTGEAVVGNVHKLKLVRGLTNSPGAYNCFLNVVVQSLWHLGPFRDAILSYSAEKLTTRSTGKAADVDVLRALCALFHAMEAEQGENTPISPRQLREALSRLKTGNDSVQRFELSDMHDAAEVLGEIFDVLHKADCDGAAVDPTLPQKVRLRKTESSALAVGSMNNKRSAVWEDDAALKKVRQAPELRSSTSLSLVQSLFGLEVVVPTAVVRQSGGRKGMHQEDVDVVEGLQYWKYMHLVPSAALREEQASLRFEEKLSLADRTERSSLPTRLLSHPAVFALGIVWESARLSEKSISSAMACVGIELDIGEVFVCPSGPCPSRKYRLRCLMAYVQSHYKAFVYSDEARAWLQFDDSNVNVIGNWDSVLLAISAHCLQPSVLFYEASDG